jgi:hypothetical protein
MPLENLRSLFGAYGFSARQARDELRMPKPTFDRMLKWGVESGRLMRFGSNRTATYRLVG